MRKLAAILSFISFIGYSQVGVGTVTPEATLDVVSANEIGPTTNVDGLLIPRVDRQRAEAMLNIPEATLIYVNSIATGTGTGIGSNITTKGFYYYNTITSKWTKLATDGNNWLLSGNAGTTAGTDYIGTTDAVDFRIKTGGNDKFNIANTSGQLQSFATGSATAPNYTFTPDTNTGVFSSGADNLNFSTAGTERVRIDDVGKVGINTTPTATLDIAAVNATGTATNVDGLLIPRVDRERARLMSSPPAGTLIYVTSLSSTATGAAVNINETGFYYYDTVTATWINFNTGQSSTTYYQTTDLTLISSNTTFTTVYSTGTITIPPNCTVLISADIGIKNNGSPPYPCAAEIRLYDITTSTAYNPTRTAVTVNGTIGGGTIYPNANMSLTRALNVTAGIHDFAIQARYPTSVIPSGWGTSAIVGSSSSTNALQGTITVTILKK